MARIFTVFTLISLALWAGGCSAPWNAPVERRPGTGYSASGGRIEGPTYRVRSGDTLYGIAWRAGVDYQDLAAWNGISPPYRIYVNQKIRVSPGKAQAAWAGSARTARVPPPPAPAPDKGVTNTSTRAGSTGGQKPVARSSSRPAPLRDVPSGSLRWAWPAKGKVVQTYSQHDPARKGIKIRGARGQAVVASEAGEVVYSGSGLVGYGQLIIIKHNKDFLSAYGHNAKRLVGEGDRVARGKTIAEMGIAAGQPQLHFEIRRRGKPVDPLALLPRR